jgi:hypothetical protein
VPSAGAICQGDLPVRFAGAPLQNRLDRERDAVQAARPCGADRKAMRCRLHTVAAVGWKGMRRSVGRACGVRLEGDAVVRWKGMRRPRGIAVSRVSTGSGSRRSQDVDLARMGIWPGCRRGQVVDVARIAQSRDRLPTRRSFTAPRSAATNNASVRGTGQSPERPPPFPTASHPQSGTTTCLATAAYWREMRRAFQSELTA